MILYQIKYLKRINEKFKKELDFFLKKNAVEGSNLIKIELEKLNQKVSVSFKIEGKKIIFFVEDIKDKNNNELVNKQLVETFKEFENLPPELISEQMQVEKKDYKDFIVNKVLKKIQEKVDKWINLKIKKII